MATATAKARCVTCGKERAVMKCGGCSQDFCFNHMTDHRQELSKQLDEIEVTRDVFRQTLTEQTSKPQKHALMQQIDQWERDSINKIRETAEEARKLLLKQTTGYFTEMEVKLNKLTNQLRESRQENDFIETDLQQWNQQLKRLKDELNKPSTIIVRHDSTPLVTKICVNTSGKI
jgi:chromosome segregation ATPase